MKTVLALFVPWLLLFCSCKQAQDPSTIDVEKLAGVYAELIVFSEHFTLARDTLSPQQYEAGYQGILRRHNLTRERFTTEFSTASQVPGLFKQLCDLAQTKIQRMRSNAVPGGMRG